MFDLLLLLRDDDDDDDTWCLLIDDFDLLLLLLLLFPWWSDELRFDDEWLLLIGTQFDDDDEDDEGDEDLAGRRVDVNIVMVTSSIISTGDDKSRTGGISQLLQHHNCSWSSLRSTSNIGGEWHSWWYNDWHLVHSIKRFLAVQSRQRHTSHEHSSNSFRLLFSSIILVSWSLVISPLSVNAMIIGISCPCMAKSVDKIVVAPVDNCTGLELLLLLESLDLYELRR